MPHIQDVMTRAEAQEMVRTILSLRGVDIEARAIAVAVGWPLGQGPTVAEDNALKRAEAAQPIDCLLVRPKHADKYPLPLGWIEFIGSGGDGKHQRMGGTLAAHSYKALTMRPGTLLQKIGDYSISEAEDTERTLKMRGPGVVVTTKGGEVVGGLRKHFMWVHKDHQRQALGLEMAVVFLLYYGYERWTFRQDQQYRMTDAVVALRRKQYDIMVERGIVANVDEATDAD